MGVGTSIGGYYDDEFHAAAEEWNSKSNIQNTVDSQLKGDPSYDEDMIKTPLETSGNVEQNIVDPMAMQRGTFTKNDPNNIYSDSGDIVDYAATGMMQPIAHAQHEFNEIDKAAGINVRPVDQAQAELNLTPQERGMYDRHLTNLYGSGGVDNEDGSRSTLYQSSVEHDGKTYNIPTVWDGKILPIDEAVKKVEAEGWDKFPAYANEKEAEARYESMHHYMEQDTGDYFMSHINQGMANKFYDAVGQKEPYNGHPIIDKLFGLNGQERYKTWPERAINELGDAFKSAGKVAAGEVPMWAQDPETGEYHTSIEGMQNAWSMMPAAMAGHIPVRIHLGNPSQLETVGSVSKEIDAWDAMVRRWRSQREAEPSFGETLDRRLAQQRQDFDAQRSLRYEGDQAFETYIRQRQEAANLPADYYNSKAAGNDTISHGKIAMSRLQSPYVQPETAHNFRFYDSNTGTIGHLHLSETQGGKNLYVEGIGLADGISPNQLGPKAMKDLLYAIKKEFPEAETIAGFRVSGARAKTRRGPAKAEMKLPENVPE